MSVVVKVSCLVSVVVKVGTLAACKVGPAWNSLEAEIVNLCGSPCGLKSRTKAPRITQLWKAAN